jgi:hypothetical protein
VAPTADFPIVRSLRSPVADWHPALHARTPFYTDRQLRLPISDRALFEELRVSDRRSLIGGSLRRLVADLPPVLHTRHLSTWFNCSDRQSRIVRSLRSSVAPTADF